jgi:hypothetical protein
MDFSRYTSMAMSASRKAPVEGFTRADFAKGERGSGQGG